MNKSKLKTYAPQARKDFIAVVTARASLLGLSETGGTLEVAPCERKGDIAIIAGREWPVKVFEQRDRLIKHMQAVGFTQTMEAVAYIWFNRFAALRYMEIHDNLDHGRGRNKGHSRRSGSRCNQKGGGLHDRAGNGRGSHHQERNGKLPAAYSFALVRNWRNLSNLACSNVLALIEN